MDIYSETLVKRKFSDKDKKKVRLLFAVIIISSFIFVLVIPFFALGGGIPLVTTASFIIFGVILFVIWRVLKSMQLEFEYIITNDTLDFDEIIAQKKRNRLVSVELKNIEEAGVYEPKKFSPDSFAFEIHAEKNTESRENFYIVFNHPQKKRTLVVFTPDDSMLSNLKKTMNPRVARLLPESV